MTPQEKAKELVKKLTLSSNAQDGSWMCKDLAKQCALIAVDEILKELEELLEGDERPSDGVYYLWEYYKEVKQEIEKL